MSTSRTPCVAVALVFLVACSAVQTSANTTHNKATESAELTALDVVGKRTAAYNAHDIEGFLATYHPNVRVYEFPDKLLGEGRERMRTIFGPQFAENDGTIAVHRQHALQNVVLSDETVTIYGRTEHNIGIYTIKDGVIVEVRLIEPADVVRE